MAIQSNRTYLIFIIHVAFWGLLTWMISQTLAFETVRVEEIDGVRQEIYTRNNDFLTALLIMMLGKIIWTYGIGFKIFPPYLSNKQDKRWMLFRLLGLGVIILGLECLLLSFGNLIWPEPDMFSLYFALYQLEILLFVLTGGLAIAYAIGVQWQKSEAEKQALTEEKLSTELNFLKSQIHPHFLFNTLNNLYALAERGNQPELSKGISDLALLMRYMIRDGSPGYVSLEKEWEMLACAIQIYQLRISEEDEVAISMELTGDRQGVQIAPLILLPFVENAFKHGINWKQASFISIQAEVKDQQLQFRVSNSRFPEIQRTHSDSSGIGLNNVRRRLDLLYPGRHSLDIEEKEHVYKIRLSLQLAE